MSEPVSDLEYLRSVSEQGMYYTHCYECREEIDSYRPWDMLLTYLCAECAERQRSVR